jgi:hypothetical protein
MRLTRQALRQDWPTSTRVKQTILETLIDYLDLAGKRGKLATDRNVIMAARTLATFASLTLRQAALDLRREKQEGKQSEVSLADLVSEAETRAETRRHERETS